MNPVKERERETSSNAENLYPQNVKTLAAQRFMELPTFSFLSFPQAAWEPLDLQPYISQQCTNCYLFHILKRLTEQIRPIEMLSSIGLEKQETISSIFFCKISSMVFSLCLNVEKEIDDNS